MINFEKTTMSTLKGAATNVTPKIRVIFIKQLPTMLPSARSGCPFFIESRLVTNSGKLVPIATIVAPITTLGTPTLVARIGAASTIK